MTDPDDPAPRSADDDELDVPAAPRSVDDPARPPAGERLRAILADFEAGGPARRRAKRRKRGRR